VVAAKVAARVVISGQVQGVGFRFATYHEAERAGVAGWVSNLADGRVEALFEGDEPAVLRLVDWCRTGPPGAFVEAVQVIWQEPTDEQGFRIERTPHPPGQAR
jgi:acylphosphatase